MKENFRIYLKQLGYSKAEIDENKIGEVYRHPVGSSTILSLPFIFSPSEADIYENHSLLWNRNSDPVFVAVGSEKSHLINVKEKPDKDRPLKKTICIETFNYGVNSLGFEHVNAELISKQSVDSAYFFEFVSRNRKRSQKTVDKDLLLNLLALKNDLVQDDPRTVHLLILRCLFIKYLEDRGIFDNDYLLKILQSGKVETLIEAFDEVAKINGDVFKFEPFTAQDISAEYLPKLALFFESDYRTGQKTLFPYRFSEIPIQLISHVYEAFLKGKSKKGKGIYYTPAFLVDFMLSQSFAEKVDSKPAATILDPAVGSGAFLVEAFKMIQQAHGGTLSFEAKKKILEEQLFGIDVDENALPIAAFSLYLALLETEDPAFVRSEIERANPILPSLIGQTLRHGNALLDDLFTNQTFDCIASNPPWGSVPTEELDVYIQERAALDNLSGQYPEYGNVADYERSQGFLARMKRWGNEETIYVAVVKNSIFLNDKTQDFRQDLLNWYDVNTFYELSHYNRILFKKESIGVVAGEKVELGASEPCVVLIFRNASGIDTQLRYVAPKLTNFAAQFELIHHTGNDLTVFPQSVFRDDDALWKTLVNGDIEGHELIKQVMVKNNSIQITARAGFKAQEGMRQLGPPVWKKVIQPQDFEQFYIKNRDFKLFNWNQELERRRDEKIFVGKRIVLPVRPLKSDFYHARAVVLEEEELMSKDNLIIVRVGLNTKSDIEYDSYLSLINSDLIGYTLFQLSPQWGKGEGKREKIRNVDIESLPLVRITGSNQEALSSLVRSVQGKKAKSEDCREELSQMNEIIFNLYGLLDYEKEIIREFYQVRVDRAAPEQERVNVTDMRRYFKAFKKAFSLILSEDHSLNGRYYISPNLGAVMTFSIVTKDKADNLKQNPELEVLNLVKSQQLMAADSFKLLFEDKVKLYDKEANVFYLIKSNRFKDWTVRQAMKDAREEIDLYINELSPA